MCGRELSQREARRAVVEGSVLILCQTCYSRLSKQSAIREVTPQPRVKQSPQISSQAPSMRSRQRRIEEYEVVDDYAIRVKNARERLGWSQEVLAQKVSESTNTIKRIEAGKLKPSIELARKLEKVLGVKLLEPIVDEVNKFSSTSKEDFLTIGDLINIDENKKKSV